MNRRLVKEIRQLALWPGVASILMFGAGPFLELGARTVLAHIFYMLVAVFIPAARVFGAEFDLGTIDRLLAQPISRERLWREKLLALAVTTALAFLLLQLAQRLLFGSANAGLDLVLCLVALTAAPLASLYFRQSFLGFFGALSLPPLAIWIWLACVYLFRGDFRVGAFWVHVPPLILFVPFGYVMARRIFLSLELARDASHELGVRASFRVSHDSTLGSTARLALKELQLQAPNLLLVPATLLLWSIIYGVARFATDVSWLGPAAVFASTSSALLTLVFPLMLGSTAIAAERQIGVEDWHASLPVSRRRRWAIKLLVVTSLALAASTLSGFLSRPLIAILEGRRVGTLPLDEWTTGVWVLAVAAGVYASSRAREPLRALMGGVALLIVALLPATSSVALEWRGDGLRSLLAPGFVDYAPYLGVAIPSLTLVAFALKSFRPEPWHWDRRAEQLFRSLVLTGALLTIGFW